MRSQLPKVLHPICGRPMVEWVIAAAQEAGAARVGCVVRPGSPVAEALPGDVAVLEQAVGEGTGAAVLAAADWLSAKRPLVVLSGDHPLVTAAVVQTLVEAHTHARAAATILTSDGIDPAGYGRVLRAPDGTVERIVETKHSEDVPHEVLAIREVNIGLYAFAVDALLEALAQVPEERGERYLTAVFPLLRARGATVAAVRTPDDAAAFGVNTRVDLMRAEATARRRLIEQHALAGVSFECPEATVVEVDVEIAPDTVIGVGCTLRRGTRIGSRCLVGPCATLERAVVGDDVRIEHARLVDCRVENGATIGPFAYLRPGTVVRRGAKIGTFVELKNADVGAGAKVPHLSYLGDAEVGAEANVAAGNITANYDGRRKHRTVIGPRVRTGVDTAFVAPVTIGEGAYTGAGSVITKDVPPGALAIARARQRNVEGWVERFQGKDESER